MKWIKIGINKFLKNTKDYVLRVKTEHLIREYFNVSFENPILSVTMTFSSANPIYVQIINI